MDAATPPGLLQASCRFLSSSGRHALHAFPCQLRMGLVLPVTNGVAASTEFWRKKRESNPRPGLHRVCRFQGGVARQLPSLPGPHAGTSTRTRPAMPVSSLLCFPRLSRVLSELGICLRRCHVREFWRREGELHPQVGFLRLRRFERRGPTHVPTPPKDRMPGKGGLASAVIPSGAGGYASRLRRPPSCPFSR
jgi:hypothetical protein